MAVLDDPAVADSKAYRFSALRALAKLDDPRSTPAFVNALQSESDEDITFFAAKHLGRLGEKSAISALVQALRNPSLTDTARSQVALSLGKLGDQRAAEPLVHALKDKDWLVRSEAATALGQVGTSRATPALIEALRDNHRLVRSSSADALVQIGDEGAVEAIEEVARKRGLGINPVLRAKAAKLRRRLGAGP